MYTSPTYCNLCTSILTASWEQEKQKNGESGELHVTQFTWFHVVMVSYSLHWLEKHNFHLASCRTWQLMIDMISWLIMSWWQLVSHIPFFRWLDVRYNQCEHHKLRCTWWDVMIMERYNQYNQIPGGWWLRYSHGRSWADEWCQTAKNILPGSRYCLQDHIKKKSWAKMKNGCVKLGTSRGVVASRKNSAKCKMWTFCTNLREQGHEHSVSLGWILWLIRQDIMCLDPSSSITAPDSMLKYWAIVPAQLNLRISRCNRSPYKKSMQHSPSTQKKAREQQRWYFWGRDHKNGRYQPFDAKASNGPRRSFRPFFEAMSLKGQKTLMGKECRLRTLSICKMVQNSHANSAVKQFNAFAPIVKVTLAAFN